MGLLVDASVRLGDALVAAGDIEQAEREYGRALDVAARTETRADDAAIGFRIGFLQVHRGDQAAGAERVRRSIRLLRDEGDVSSASWYSRTHDYAAMIAMLGPLAPVEEVLSSEAEIERGRN